MKKFVTVLLAISMLFTLCACGNEPTDVDEKIDLDSIEFTKIDLLDIDKACSENPLKAEQTYKGQYVEFVGEIASITEEYIEVKKYEGNDLASIYFAPCATCYIENDSLKDMLLSLKTGDEITVKGKITYVYSAGSIRVDSYVWSLS